STETGRPPRVYTKTGDDGTTDLLYGGRMAKDAPAMQVNGTVDEAQAVLGLARADLEPGSDLDALLVRLERELYVLMAEVATAPKNRSKLVAGKSLVTEAMVTDLEHQIDVLLEDTPMPADFVVPGANRPSAALDLARTVIRRAERLYVAQPLEGSSIGPYLNRLSDLLWALARHVEGESHLLARGPRRGARRPSSGSPSA
ncbi:MAG: cob(I)yrinic acid a,c-diamide adenosyltransferase, partial [Acidimicrobiales bacterium]|nr:cob(I)yrinic acid a,c-diamide adenosyltransferase [Acidimicrobiales bacterium]